MRSRLAATRSGADGERPGAPPTTPFRNREAAMQSSHGPEAPHRESDERDEHRRHSRELSDAIAANLTRLRRNSGIDVDELAAGSGVAREQVLALEAGRATPTLRSLWALA